jgi:acetyltransferase-like isoleucine patch superfamily enzyme
MSVEFRCISPDVVLGENVTISEFTNLYGCTIGDGTRVGAFVEIQKGASIGKNCKISSHSFVCEGVAIQDNVFVGHNVTFINDKYPRATRADGSLQTEEDWDVVPTLVEKGASIGSSVTILCGVTIGAGAMVGAGSVVTRDIPAQEIWVGNPARFLKKVEK